MAIIFKNLPFILGKLSLLSTFYPVIKTGVIGLANLSLVTRNCFLFVLSLGTGFTYYIFGSEIQGYYNNVKFSIFIVFLSFFLLIFFFFMIPKLIVKKVNQNLSLEDKNTSIHIFHHISRFLGNLLGILASMFTIALPLYTLFRDPNPNTGVLFSDYGLKFTKDIPISVKLTWLDEIKAQCTYTPEQWTTLLKNIDLDVIPSKVILIQKLIENAELIKLQMLKAQQVQAYWGIPHYITTSFENHPYISASVTLLSSGCLAFGLYQLSSPLANLLHKIVNNVASTNKDLAVVHKKMAEHDQKLQEVLVQIQTCVNKQADAGAPTGDAITKITATLKVFHKTLTDLSADQQTLRDSISGLKGWTESLVKRLSLQEKATTELLSAIKSSLHPGVTPETGVGILTTGLDKTSDLLTSIRAPESVSMDSVFDAINLK